MRKIEPAVRWIRENAALLALSVAVLTFIGGVFSGIGAAVWYLSTLATTEHVTATVAEALRPLGVTTRTPKCPALALRSVTP